MSEKNNFDFFSSDFFGDEGSTTSETEKNDVSSFLESEAPKDDSFGSFFDSSNEEKKPAKKEEKQEEKHEENNSFFDTFFDSDTSEPSYDDRDETPDEEEPADESEESYDETYDDEYSEEYDQENEENQEENEEEENKEGNKIPDEEETNDEPEKAKPKRKKKKKEDDVFADDKPKGDKLETVFMILGIIFPPLGLIFTIISIGKPDKMRSSAVGMLLGISLYAILWMILVGQGIISPDQVQGFLDKLQNLI